MPHTDIRLLGPPQVLADGRPVQFDTRKTSALLFFLAASGRPHARDWLTELIWPQRPRASGRHLLRNSLYVLRRVLPGYISGSRTEVRLVGPCSVDVACFRQLLSDCDEHHPEGEGLCNTCIAHLQRAVALQRGELLEGFDSGSSQAT